MIAEALATRVLKRFGYIQAVGAFCVLFATLYASYFAGDVAFPGTLRLEFGVEGPASSTAGARIENSKFNDAVTAFVPEIKEHLTGARSGWIATWSDSNALGRPLGPLLFSPAYAPSRILMSIVDSPFRILTILSLGASFLLGLFFILLGHELRWPAWAALLAAAGATASPYLNVVITFPMFIFAWTWTAGMLFATMRLSRGPDLLAWSVLAFSVYSMAMTAYPQSTVYHGYMLLGFGSVVAWGVFRRSGGCALAVLLLGGGSAVLAGAACAAPSLLDLAHRASQSARSVPDIEFLSSALPRIGSFNDAIEGLVLASFPELLGNPISPRFPFAYWGLSFSPIVVFLAAVAILLRAREVWAWILVVLAVLAIAFVPGAYAFGVEHLWFGLSRTNPISLLIIPLAILSGYGASALLARERTGEGMWRILGAAGLVLALLLVATSFAVARTSGLPWLPWTAAAIATGAALLQFRRSRPAVLFLALLIGALTTIQPMLLRQDPALITTTSPLVDALRRELPGESRLAAIGPGIRPMRPNTNVLIGLRSVHSHDSLSSQRYQDLIAGLGGKVMRQGRWNTSIAPDFDSDLFWMSNVGLLLSSSALEGFGLEYRGRQRGIRLYRVSDRMGCCARIALAEATRNDDGFEVRGLNSMPKLATVRTLDQGDRQVYAMQATAESLLILSQIYHRGWRATARTSAGDVEAVTMPVNGIFQGVVLPAGTSEMEFRFLPFARHAWVGHVLFGFLACLLVIAGVMKVVLKSRFGALRTTLRRQIPDRCDPAG